MLFVVSHHVGIINRQAYLIEYLVSRIWIFFVRGCSARMDSVNFEFSNNSRGNVLWNTKNGKIKYTFVLLQNLVTYEWLDDSGEYQ